MPPLPGNEPGLFLAVNVGRCSETAYPVAPRPFRFLNPVGYTDQAFCGCSAAGLFAARARVADSRFLADLAAVTAVHSHGARRGRDGLDRSPRCIEVTTSDRQCYDGQEQARHPHFLLHEF